MYSTSHVVTMYPWSELGPRRDVVSCMANLGLAESRAEFHNGARGTRICQELCKYSPSDVSPDRRGDGLLCGAVRNGMECAKSRHTRLS